MGVEGGRDGWKRVSRGGSDIVVRHVAKRERE
jgi:hypothetical protein